MVGKRKIAWAYSGPIAGRLTGKLGEPAAQAVYRKGLAQDVRVAPVSDYASVALSLMLGVPVAYSQAPRFERQASSSGEGLRGVPAATSEYDALRR